MGRGDERPGTGMAALVAVELGAIGVAASLTCVYHGMRKVMVENGGFCASGGPYQISAGHVCSSDVIWLLFGGIVAGIVFAMVLATASLRFSRQVAAAVPLLLWAAVFGALGWNFIELGFDPPPQMNGSTGWKVCGVVFWLMALGGLIPGLLTLANALKGGTGSMQEFDDFGLPTTGAAPSPTQRAGATSPEFIDPVTGERHGGDDA